MAGSYRGAGRPPSRGPPHSASHQRWVGGPISPHPQDAGYHLSATAVHMRMRGISLRFDLRFPESHMLSFFSRAYWLSVSFLEVCLLRSFTHFLIGPLISLTLRIHKTLVVAVFNQRSGYESLTT